MQIFRLMQAEDIPQVLAIENQVFTPPWPFSAFAASLHDHSYVLVDGDSIIGYLMCIVVIDECSIINIAVHPKYQRKGFGALMFAKIFELLIPLGIVLYYLDVRQSNLAAQSLYEKLGFRRIALRKSYYSEPEEDAVVMCLDLEKPPSSLIKQ